MALTQEQIRIMDKITEDNLKLSQNNNVQTNKDLNNYPHLTPELIEKMDKIGGFDNTSEIEEQQQEDLRKEIINEDKEKAQQWLDKGAIKPFEMVQQTAKYFNGKADGRSETNPISGSRSGGNDSEAATGRRAKLFQENGTYDNIDNNAHLTKFGNWVKNSDWSKSRSSDVDARLEREKQQKLERNKRVNEGTASFFDRMGAALDRFGSESYKNQEETVDINEQYQNIDRNDKTKRYEITGVNQSTGMPVYNEIDLLKKIGFLEASSHSIEKGTGIGAIENAVDNKKERDILKRIYNNEPIRQDELDFVNRRYEEEKEKIVRGYSTGGKLGEAFGYSMGITADIVLGSALFNAIGGTGLALNLGTKAQTVVQGTKNFSYLAPYAKMAMEETTNAIAGGAVTTLVNAPYRLFDEYQSRMLNNEMQVTDTGIKIFKESDEKPATALLKSLGKLYVMYGVEMGLGSVLGAAAKAGGQTLNKYALTPVMGKLFEKYPKLEKLMNQTTIEFAKKYERLNNLPVVGKSTGWMKDNAHFDGFLEEMGEEALEDVLNRIIGTNNEERNLEGFAKDIFKTPEEWLVISGCIALQGGSMALLQKGMSATDFVLGNAMAEKGIEKEKIEEVLSEAAQEQKSQLVDELIKKGDLTLDINNPEYTKRQELHQNFINDIKQGANIKDIDDDVINDTAKIMSESVANLANNIGMDVDVLNQKFKFKTQTLSDEQAIKQVNEDEQAEINRIKETEINQNNKKRKAEQAEQKNVKTLKEITFIDDLPINITDKSIDIGNLKKGNTYKILKETSNGLKVDELKFYRAGYGVIQFKNKKNRTVEFDIENLEDTNKIYNIDFDIENELQNTSQKANAGNLNFQIIENNQFNEDKNFDINSYFQQKDVIENIQKSKNNFKKQLDLIKQGNNKSKTEPIVLYKPTEILKRLGLADEKIVFHSSKIKKNIKEHGITYKDLEKIPELLANPLYIFESKTDNDAFVAVLTNDKEPLIAAFKTVNDKLVVKNIIKSAYNKGQNFINQEIKEERLLYDRKNPTRFRRHRASIAQVKTSSDNNIVPQFQTNLNPFVKEHKSNNNILFQSAYHGTPHRFDEFSIDNIGTGEGAQVHGWGLYFAENKEVSEDYRKTLSKDTILYNGKEYNVRNKEFFVLNNILEKGKENIIQDKENDLKEQKYILSLEDKKIRKKELEKLEKERKNVLDNREAYPKDSFIKINAMLNNIARMNENKFYFYAIKERTEAIENDIKYIKSIDETKIEKKKCGQLFEVDIPENDVLLDEQKTFSEQSKTVQTGIIRVVDYLYKNQYKYGNIDNLSYTLKTLHEGETKVQGKYDITGGMIYNEISDIIGSAKNTSLMLNNRGIKGITYDGQIDGRCYVIFDDKAVNVLKKYYQSLDEQDYNEQTTEQGIKNSRGFTYQKTNFDGTAKENMIVLLKGKADRSTLLHEFAHIYLNVLNELAQENKRAKEMLLKINKQLRYDGREYTTSQLEKFAEMFEAYVKTGKAPTYGLKKAFEHFRNWLGDIYNAISRNGKYEISKEWQDIFDELLGDKSIDVKEKQIDELLEKAHNYANLKISKLDEEKPINQNVLTDKQLRYRDTAYEIMFYALKNSKNEETRNYIQNIEQLRMILGAKSTKKDAKGLVRQRERLEMVLAETDDAFSANDGFLPEWGEFFNDPGVNNKEQGADAELALNAYNVIVNKSYLQNENNLEEFTQNDINLWQYELDYILEEYEKEKEENKTQATCAFYKWIDSVHPYMYEEFLKQWETKTNEIDRYQKLDKWQKAKEDLKLEAARMKMQGDNHWQFMEFVRKILTRLDFITETDKAKLFDRLKEYTTMRDIERNLDDVFDFAKTLYGVSERRHLADDIQREVKQTIHEWQNGIKKTKYTYPANKLFTRLREINKMDREQIEYLYDSTVNEETTINYTDENSKPVDFYEQIEKDFITFKYNGSYYNSAEFLSNLLKDIQTAKFEAKLARDEIDFNRRMEQINLVDELASAVDVRAKNITDIVKKTAVLNSAGANFNGFLKMLFNDNIKEKFSLDYLYAQKDAQVGTDRRYFIEEAKKIFGFKGKFSEMQLFNKFIDMNKADEFEIKQRYTPDIVNGTYRETVQDKETGKNYTVKTVNLKTDVIRNEWDDEPVKLSRMQVIYYYIMSKNPETYKMLTDMGDETTPAKGQFDEYEFNNMIDQLTPQEKLLGNLMQNCAEKYWNKLNAYHIKKYHTELGKVKNYFPRQSETGEVKMLDMFNDFVQFSAVGKFQKQRTAGPGVRIKGANALAVLFDHIEKANTIIIMGEKLDLMNRVFKEPNLKNKIQAVWGDKITTEFYNQITGNLFTGQSVNQSLTEGFFSKLINNVVKANIFGKAQIGLKQLISFMNYGKGDDYVSASEWMKAFTKQTFTPSEWKKNIDYMMNIPYLKDRFSRGGSTDALKRELETKMFSKISLLDDIWSMPVKLGDIGAIILGGKPYIDCLIQNGYKEQEAIKIFIETTVNDQQSSIPSTLSNLQRNSGKTPWGKLIFAYQNTPWQYYRQCTNAVMETIQKPNKKNILKASKMLFVYGWLFPAIFNIASSLSPLTWFNAGDDDDFWQDINPLKTFASLFTQHPIFGEALKGLLDALNGKTYNNSDLFSKYIKSLNKLVRDIKKDELTFEDVFNAIGAISESATGAPVYSFGNSLSGLYDITQGDFTKGALKTLGYSDYRANTAVGEN